MAILKTKKLILALLHELPKVVASVSDEQTKEKMLLEIRNLYRKLDLYNFIINNYYIKTRKAGI